MLRADLALDFGSVTTRVARPNGAVIYEAPTLVGLDRNSGQAVAFGSAAAGLGAQSSGRIEVVHPVVGGQLADIDAAELLLSHVFAAVGHAKLRRRRVLVTSPIGATPVQLRAIEQALDKVGVSKVRFLEQPLASALGARIAIEAPLGTMVVDVGGEITNIGVIALGGVVIGTTVACGGETLDAALRSTLLEGSDIVIDHTVARDLRRRLGTVGAVDPQLVGEIVGRDRSSGALRSMRITQQALAEIFECVLGQIFLEVRRCIAESPPDVANDLMGSGIVLAGGGSLFDGFGRRLAVASGIPVHVHEQPARLGVVGAARCLSTFNELESALKAAPQR